MTETKSADNFAHAPERNLSAEDVVKRVHALEPDLRRWWAYLHNGAVKIIRTLLAERDPVPLFGRLILDRVNMPAACRTGFEAAEALAAEAAAFDEGAFSDDELGELSERLVRASTAEDSRLADYLSLIIHGAGAISAGYPTAGTESQLALRLQYYGIGEEEAEALVVSARRQLIYLDVDETMRYEKEEDEGDEEEGDEEENESETAEDDAAREEADDSEKGSSSIIDVNTDGRVILCMAANPVPLREMTAALRKVSRRSRAFWAFVHNELFGFLKKVSARTDEERLAHLKAVLPDPLDAEDVLEQLRISETAFAVLKKDAAEFQKRGLRSGTYEHGPALGKLFRGTEDIHPLESVITLLVQAVSAEFEVPDCLLPSRAVTARPWDCPLWFAAKGAALMLGLHFAGKPGPQNGSADTRAADDAAAEDFLSGKPLTKLNAALLWETLAKRLAPDDLMRFRRWVESVIGVAAWYGASRERMKLLVEFEGETSDEKLERYLAAVACFRDFAAYSAHLPVTKVRSIGENLRTDSDTELCRSTAERIADALYAQEGPDWIRIRAGFCPLIGFAALILRDNAVTRGESRPGEEHSMIAPDLQKPCSCLSLLGSMIAGRERRKEEEAKADNGKSEIEHVRMLAKLFAEEEGIEG